MSLLIDMPLIAGLRYREEVITKAAENELLDRLGALELAPFHFRSWLGNRKTQTFGWSYNFEDSRLVRAEPIPDWLFPLREQIAAFSGVKASEFVHVLVARYDPGAGIGWHRDRDVFEKVAGISLCTSASLRFRQRTATSFKRTNLEVAPRSAYFLSGEARHDWEHSISPGGSLRFSITLRTLSSKGLRIAGKVD